MWHRFKQAHIFTKIVVSSTAVFTGTIVGTGVYGTRQINTIRKRWVGDDFVLTPESMRMPYEKAAFTTEDNVTLRGWFINQTAQGKKTPIVLAFSPYNHDKSALLGVARGLWEGGYSVLLFDFRSFAKERVRQTVGHLEIRDARAALNWLLENKKDSKIAFIGASMGGAVALCLAEECADKGQENVVAVATDCAFHNLKDVVRQTIIHEFPIFSKEPMLSLVLETISLFNYMYYGYRLTEVGPSKNISNLKVPLLLIHSENDQIVPVEHVFKLHTEAATPEEYKKFVVVPNTHHIGAFFNSEKTYTKLMVQFLDSVFNDHLEEITAMKTEREWRVED